MLVGGVDADDVPRQPEPLERVDQPAAGVELGVYQVDFDRSGSPTEVAGLSLGPPAPLARERRVLAAAGVGGATRLTCLS